MSSTAPPISPSTATTANGTRYQVGRMVVRAPIGSSLIAARSSGSEPASPRPNPVIMNTSAPMNAWAVPEGSAVTAAVSMWSRTSSTYPTVRTAVTTVMTVCIRMMRSNPKTPPAMMSAATTTSATTCTPVPPPQPSASTTVAVARVASAVRIVSQPTVSSQDSTAATRLPCTPSAARDSTIVGADPRLPASATIPQSRNENTMPTTLATTAWPNDTPKSSTHAP